MDYYRPEGLNDALNWLDRHQQVQPLIAAGCTDLLALTRNTGLTGSTLDITAISALSGIEERTDCWRIGATTTWSEIIRHGLPAAFDGLKLAAREVGSIQIQNTATLAGNLCNASPAADGVPCLLALDAIVELSSAHSQRSLPLSEFILGARDTALMPGEIVTAISVPKAAATGHSVFLKLGARKYLIISIAMVAAGITVESGIISRASIAVGACSAVAQRLGNIERMLLGKPPDLGLLHEITDDLVALSLSPIDDVRADTTYRYKSAGELVRRAVGQLMPDQSECVA